MIEVSVGLFLATFVAGLLMFLAPCTLPLVPAYLAFISGVRDTHKSELTTLVVKKVQRNGLAFTIGFSVVFVLLGVLFGVAGSFLGQFRIILSQIGGVFIVFFGLTLLGVFRLPFLNSDKRISLPSGLTPGKPSSSFLMGSIFALGWTPCVGPILASVLLIAATKESLVTGGLLLSVFSLGMAIPFLITSFFYAKATTVIKHASHITTYVSWVGGVFLIFLGVLLTLGDFGLVLDVGYDVFYRLGLDWLFNYL